MTEPDRSASFASRSDPSRPARWVSSWVARAATSARRRALRQGLGEAARRLRGRKPRIHYFHQVGDPYSSLAVQALRELQSKYDVEFVPHLAAAEEGPNLPEPEMLAALARRDCVAIAPHYGLEFPEKAPVPEARALRIVEDRLAATLTSPSEFATAAVELERELWNGAPVEPDGEGGVTATAEGAELRRRLGHYSGAMFYYNAEWYWGVDRLYLLERRLGDLGVAREPGPARFRRPSLPGEPVAGGERMTLEVFPSLRSPYTAIGFEPALRMAESMGLRTLIRPVLPMVMRGVPATFRKGLYIFSDTQREAAALDMPFGRMLDPIGEPVRRAYSLWPWARAQGRGAAFLAAFLRGAFAEALDTSTDAGLRKVVETAGLSWAEALPHLGDPSWEREIEDNQRVMIEELGQWGVPSFRLRGPGNEPDFCCWGQDRLWLIGREIERRASAEAGVEET